MTTQPLTKSEVQSNNKTAEEKVELLHISTSPHIHHPGSVPKVMMWVMIALVPSIIASYLFFGWRAIFLTCVGITSAVLTEWLITLLMKKPSTIGDFSAVITGILLAFNVPPSLPWWMVAIGAAFAIGVAKMAFGGLGGNFINPALAGRAFLMASYPAAMTSFTAPKLGTISGLDGITSATPLAHFKLSMMNGSFQALDFQDAIYNLFTGNVGGCIGETSAIALLLGAMILWYKRIIGFAIPLFYIGTVFVLFWLFNGTGDLFTSGAIIVPTYQILAGGLLLGAFFMATDMVTSPITPNGKIVFGIGCGVLTFVIRKFGGYPEGVSYSILLMNLLVPLIEKYTRPRIYGRVKK